MKTNSLIPVAAIFAVFSPAFLSAAVTTFPYAENFDSLAPGDTTPANFIEGGTSTAISTIVANAGGQGYQLKVASGDSTFGQAQTTGFVGQSFTFSTQFTVPAFYSGTGTQNLNLSLLALGNDTISTGYRLTYGLGTLNNGQISLSETSSTNLVAVDGTGGGANPVFSTGSLAPSTTATYTLTLTATYTSATTLSLAGTLFNGTSTITVAANDLSGLQAGNDFGIRLASGGSSGATATVVADNLALGAIPEPSAALLGAIGALGLLRRKR